MILLVDLQAVTENEKRKEQEAKAEQRKEKQREAEERQKKGLGKYKSIFILLFHCILARLMRNTKAFTKILTII